VFHKMVDAIGGGIRGEVGGDLYRGSSCSCARGSSNELRNFGERDPTTDLNRDIVEAVKSLVGVINQRRAGKLCEGKMFRRASRRLIPTGVANESSWLP
jgi:hypothetical protein